LKFDFSHLKLAIKAYAQNTNTPEPSEKAGQPKGTKVQSINLIIPETFHSGFAPGSVVFESSDTL